jgi:hypothetical protein
MASHKQEREKVASELAEIAMRALAKLPAEEREARISAFEKREFTASGRKTRGTFSSTRRAPATRAIARDRR